MRKVYGVKKLVIYLDSVGYPLTEEQINQLILNKEIPHLRPIGDIIAFNLEYIDWWISHQKITP